MTTSDKYKFYLEELGGLIKDHALRVKTDLINASDEEKIFNQGQLYAYYRLVTIMQQQAIAFDIDLTEINISDIDPDNQLI